MAFLSCRSCHWSQDDFWDASHNPIRFLAERVEPLLLQPTPALDTMEEPSRMTLRDALVVRFLEAAQITLNMRYRTVEEYRRLNPEGRCPSCEQHTLTID